jgi:hypothetical protein
MAEDQRRGIRVLGALGGGREDRRLGEERFLEDVRREIQREVAAAIRDEIAHAVDRNSTEGWKRLEHMLAQQAEEAQKQAEEEREWRLDVARRLEALEQALRVGSAFQGSAEERTKDIERGTECARVESEGQTTYGGGGRTTTCGEGRPTPGTPKRAPATPQHQGGLAESQHATEKRPEPRSTRAATPGLGAVNLPRPTWANIAGKPATTKVPVINSDGFTMVGRNGRV